LDIMRVTAAATAFPFLVKCSGEIPDCMDECEVDSLVRFNPGEYDSGLCLDYTHDEDGLRNGLPILLSSCETAPKWHLHVLDVDYSSKLYNLNSGKTIQVPDSNFCVDVPGNDHTNGNFLWLWTCGATDLSHEAQGWGSSPNGLEFTSWKVKLAWTIRNASENVMCMGAVYNDGYAAGTYVQLWDCLAPGETTDQDWSLDELRHDKFAHALV